VERVVFLFPLFKHFLFAINEREKERHQRAGGPLESKSLLELLWIIPVKQHEHILDTFAQNVLIPPNYLLIPLAF
jgi:hypothetical protein